MSFTAMALMIVAIGLTSAGVTILAHRQHLNHNHRLHLLSLVVVEVIKHSIYSKV
jgi:hypothetical protein